MIWIIWIAVAVITLSVVYHLIPAKTPKRTKPGLVWFPKYQMSIDDHDAFQKNLNDLEFRKIGEAHFVRGHPLGDFSAKWLKLNVSYNPETKMAALGSPLFGILFDTGDLWKITQKLMEKQ